MQRHEFSTWGQGSNAPREVREAELGLERKVSEIIGAMPFLWLTVDDAPDAESLRGYVERNAIALLRDLETRGDEVISGLGWLRKTAGGGAAFLGLDQAADQSGLQLPDTLSGLRQMFEPLAGNLAWLIANKWALGMVGCVGLFAFADWLRKRLLDRAYQHGAADAEARQEQIKEKAIDAAKAEGEARWQELERVSATEEAALRELEARKSKVRNETDIADHVLLPADDPWLRSKRQ